MSLRTEPADGYDSVDELIAHAGHTIDLTMYELADDHVEAELVAARRRGVAVRVLLDRAYGGASVNRAAFSMLEVSGVPVRWGSDTVIFHQKTLTVDGDVSAVMTGNLTSREYTTTRDFVVIDRNPAAVSAIETVFASDWNRAPVEPGPAVDGLVWSPGSAKELVTLIDSAHHSLIIENEEMDSVPIESSLEAASRRGVHVEVAMTADPGWDSAFTDLTDAGVRVATYPDAPGDLYLHAKAIVVDGTVAFIGSQNFSTSSLEYNRELGVITSDPAVVDPVLHTLTSDFDGGDAWATVPR